METPSHAKGQLAALSLSLCLGGVLLAAALMAAGQWYGSDLRVPAFLLFLGCQIPALVCGIVSWSTPSGKAGAWSAGILTLVSLLCLG